MILIHPVGWQGRSRKPASTLLRKLRKTHSLTAPLTPLILAQTIGKEGLGWPMWHTCTPKDQTPPDSQFSKCRFPGSSPSLEPLPTHSPGLTGTQLPTSPAATWLHRDWKIGAGRGREGTSQSKRLGMEGLEHRHVMTNLRSFNDQPRVPKSTLCWSACQCSIFRF